MDGSISQSQQRAPNPTSAPGVLSIDLAALKRNYRLLTATLFPKPTGAVVKADAYGLGAEKISQALYAEGCRYFFVEQLTEAQQLRSELPQDAYIIVLNGLLPGSEMVCAESQIVPVLNSLQQFQRWSHAASTLKRTLPAVLQFDTGMCRLGFPPEERNYLTILRHDACNIDVLFIMSHLASADDVASEQNHRQLAEMQRLAGHLLASTCVSQIRGASSSVRPSMAISPDQVSPSMAVNQTAKMTTAWSRSCCSMLR